MSEQKQSLGESRVRVSFNPSEDNLVDQVKKKTAELIDMIGIIDERMVSEGYSTLSQADKECVRLIDKARTSYEEAAMWAVKALTSASVK